MILLALLACQPHEAPTGPHAIAFDGGEDCGEVDVGGLDVPAAFTVEAWIRGEPAPSEQARPVVSWGGVFTLGEAFGGDTAFRVGDGAATSAQTVMDGVLHHLAGTWDGAQASLYVDGLRQAFAAGTASTDATDTLRVGCDADVNAYEGLLDEVRVSKVVRYTGDFEVVAAPFAPDADTFALFHFDEGEGEQSADAAQGLVANVYGVDWIPFELGETE